MTTLRTPDEHFDQLIDWPFEPRYVTSVTEIGELRIAHVDEGPRDGPVVLLMHGEPTWGYLYRHMIGPLTDAGHRVIVPDLVGFGRSDKPITPVATLYRDLVRWMTAWFDALALRRVVLFCQDWGGLVGLRLLTDRADRFRGLVVANTGLPTGAERTTDPMRDWTTFAATVPVFPVGAIVDGGSARDLTAAEIAAYEAPFPTEESKHIARHLPSCVPTSTDSADGRANERAWDILETWPHPVLTLFSDGDPITRGGERAFRRRCAGAADQPHRTITGAGHFLQEDAPAILADEIIRFTRTLDTDR